MDDWQTPEEVAAQFAPGTAWSSAAAWTEAVYDGRASQRQKWMPDPVACVSAA
jgi:hypothetical protein